MVFREVDVIEVREVLRGWLPRVGLRTVVASGQGWIGDGPPVRGSLGGGRTL